MPSPTPANSGTAYLFYVLARAVLALIEGKKVPAEIITALRFTVEAAEEEVR